MAAKYRKINPRFWDDEKVMKLDSVNTLIAAYCLSNKETNRVGIYAFSVGLGSELTKVPKADFVRRFLFVRERLGWPFDIATRVLYLPTWWKYNQPENPSHFVGCLSDLHDLPTCYLIGDFLKNDTYLDNDCKELLCRRAPLFATRVPTPVPTRVPTGGGEQEQEQEQEQDIESSLRSLSSPSQNGKLLSAANQWPEEHQDLLQFLSTQKYLNYPLAQCGLLEFEFWDALSEACGGLSLDLVIREFAKMAIWFKSNRAKTHRGLRRFVSNWLVRAAEQEGRNAPKR